MNPQFWLFWIGVVAVGYVVLVPVIIVLAMKAALNRQVTLPGV
jgi:hypothetical protein